MTALSVLDCGAGTTIQDSGRFGFQRFGVGPAGAMDRLALAEANLLVGNAPDAAALEFVLFGGTFRVEAGDTRVALAGADGALSVDGEPIPPLTSATARAGQTIRVAPARRGTFMVMAVAGGITTRPDLGSRSFHLRAGLGGIDRRAVRAGDLLPVGEPATTGAELVAEAPIPRGDGAFRILFGPQDDYFTAEGLATLTSEAFTITREADRMGFRLSGPPIRHAKGFNIVSDGIATGAIQVPGDGQPIVLLADRQTTGGYPKAAGIITTDLARFVQMRPGSAVRFQAVSQEEAVAAARERAAAIDRFRQGLRPLARGLDSERLLGLNLIDGVTAGEP